MFQWEKREEIEGIAFFLFGPGLLMNLVPEVVTAMQAAPILSGDDFSLNDFNISMDLFEAHLDRVYLMLTDEATSFDQKQEWYYRLPHMSPEEVKKLFAIIVTSRLKLNNTYKKYIGLSQEEIQEIARSAQQQPAIR